MKYVLFFSLILLVGCKKKNPAPETTKLNYTMTHSGLIDGVAFSYSGSSLDTAFLKTDQSYDYWLTRYYDLYVWIDGKHFDENVALGERRIYLDFESYIHYTYSDINAQGLIPELNGSKLAQAYNDYSNGTTSLNAMISDTASSFGIYDCIGLQMQAENLGSAIHLSGSADSIAVGYFTPVYWITNFQFDYTFPLNP